MSWLPKRDKLDPVQASAIDFAVAQEGNFSIKGEAGTTRLVGFCTIEMAVLTLFETLQFCKVLVRYL